MAKRTLIDFKPVKALLVAWICAGIFLAVLVSGEQFFLRFKDVFGTRVLNYSIMLSNQVRESSAARPLAEEGR